MGVPGKGGSDKSDLATLTREGYALCGARRRSTGEPCLAIAGSGTDHKGIGRCKFHGGNTRNHRKNAVVREAKTRRATLGLPVEVPASEALLWVVHATAGHAAWLSQEVAALPREQLGEHEGRVLVEMYGQERDRLTRASKAALDAGADARQLDLAEKFGSIAVQVIAGILDDLGVRNHPDAPATVERHLRNFEKPTLGLAREEEDD